MLLFFIEMVKLKWQIPHNDIYNLHWAGYWPVTSVRGKYFCGTFFIIENVHLYFPILNLSPNEMVTYIYMIFSLGYRHVLIKKFISKVINIHSNGLFNNKCSKSKTAQIKILFEHTSMTAEYTTSVTDKLSVLQLWERHKMTTSFIRIIYRITRFQVPLSPE